MLDFLKGTVKGVSEDAAVIAVGGVGVRIEMPTQDLAKLDDETTVFTMLQIRDEEVHLYGFATERARELFRALTSVQGVGPKVGLAILSAHSVDALERAIATGDEGALLLVSGVGKKTAARIVLDLRDKVGTVVEPVQTTNGDRSPIGAVREGLKGLGYSAQEISDVLAALPPDGDEPTLMRHALRALGQDKASMN